MHRPAVLYPCRQRQDTIRSHERADRRDDAVDRTAAARAVLGFLPRENADAARGRRLAPDTVRPFHEHRSFFAQMSEKRPVLMKRSYQAAARLREQIALFLAKQHIG